MQNKCTLNNARIFYIIYIRVKTKKKKKNPPIITRPKYNTTTLYLNVQ